jgi:DNA replication protein DnaC
MDYIQSMSKVFKNQEIKTETLERTCEHHGPYQSMILVLGQITLWESGCPICTQEYEAREQVENEAQERAIAEKTKRRIQEDRIRELKTMGLEPLYYGVTFESFEANTPELAKALEALRRLVTGEIQQLVMTGKNGTGKTHLACSALKELGGRIVTAFELSARVRATYQSNANHTDLEVLDELSSVPLLVIDELGRTKGSNAEANYLSYIIDKRHSRGLPLIIISNRHIRKNCERGRCPECLENFLTEDIMSRIAERGRLLQFTGADWRKENH